MILYRTQLSTLIDIRMTDFASLPCMVLAQHASRAHSMYSFLLLMLKLNVLSIAITNGFVLADSSLSDQSVTVT